MRFPSPILATLLLLALPLRSSATATVVPSHWSGPFAGFTQQDPAAKAFVFDNNGASPGAATFNAGSPGNGVPVVFSFAESLASALPSGLQGSLNATLVMQSSTANGASVLGSVFNQRIDSGSIEFTLAGAVDAGADTLLRVVFQNANLSGLKRDDQGVEWAVDLTSAVEWMVVTYSSDFIRFGPDAEAWKICLTGVEPPFTVHCNGLLNDFKASGRGVFEYCGEMTPVPEPGTYALLAGIAAPGFVSFRRWRRAT